MNIRPVGVGRVIVFTGVLGVIAASVGSGACVVDEIPACPGQCFEYTVEYEVPERCQNDAGDYDIPFTGTAPDGYRGRFCFNSSSVAQVVEAIDHIKGGGQISDLSVAVQSAYVSTVNSVKDDIQAECITAAPGQCTNADQVCTGVAADAYVRLVVDQTCVLELGGVEPIALDPGEVCEFAPVDQATGSTESGDPCTEGTTGGGTGVDETSGSGGADETSEGTTGMMFGPFGDIDTLVRCNRQSVCEVDRELVSNLSAHFEVFWQERVTLTIVGKDVPCGPGARIGGLGTREHSTELADAFGLRNGDIIREIEATTLEDPGDAMDAMASLLEDPSTTIVGQRTEGSRCETFALEIQVL
jgi:hypothetical protein